MSELPYRNYFDVKPKRITTNRLEIFIVHSRTSPYVFPTRKSGFIWAAPSKQINPQHQYSTSSTYYIHRESFYILLTVHHVMILGKWPTWRTNYLLCIYFCFNSLHVSSTSCSSSGETNCINTTSGNRHSENRWVMCVGGHVLVYSQPAHETAINTDYSPIFGVTVTRGCIDTICLSWWWARCARNM